MKILNSVEAKLNKTTMPPFPDWNTGIVSNRSISKKSLIRVYRESEMKEYRTRLMRIQSTTGQILRGDHTFKMAKISQTNQAKLFTGLFNVVNERNQVIGYWLTTSKSLTELKEPFQKVNSQKPRKYNCLSFK